MDGMILVEPIRSIPHWDPPGAAPHSLARPILLMAVIGLMSFAIILGLDMAGMPLPADIGVLG